MIATWLARLAFSFIVIAAVLAWTAYRASTAPGQETEAWRITLYMVAAVLSFILGLAGLRERHRRDE